MRKIIIGAVLLAVLIIPGVASAKRLATPAQKQAMTHHMRNGLGYKVTDLNFPAREHIPPRCLVAWISTANVRGASRWGAWSWSKYGAYHEQRCKTANGVTAVHFVRGHWYEVGGGSSFTSIPGMPKAVFRDLF